MTKTYRVEARLKTPGSYHSGYDFTVYAKTKGEAVKYARKDAYNQGHTRQDGALVFKAYEEEGAGR